VSVTLTYYLCMRVYIYIAQCVRDVEIGVEKHSFGTFLTFGLRKAFDDGHPKP
jgi:hypothetical protein